MTAKQSAQLPDDIEQKVLDGQRLRATYDLMERRGVTLDEARELVGRWLYERQQTKKLFVGSASQSVRLRLQPQIELRAVPGAATIRSDHR